MLSNLLVSQKFQLSCERFAVLTALPYITGCGPDRHSTPQIQNKLPLLLFVSNTWCDAVETAVVFATVVQGT